MTKTRMLIALFALAAATQAAVPLSAVQQQRASPHETVNATVADAKISIIYGRQNAKGRPIFGKLVPWGTAWRAGADEATTLVTDKALDFGGTNGAMSIGQIAIDRQCLLAFSNPLGGPVGRNVDVTQDQVSQCMVRCQ